MLHHFKKCHSQAFFIILSVSFVVTVALQLYDTYVRYVENSFFAKQMAGMPSENKSSCRLPNFSPFDPSIAKYIKSWPKINCGKPQPPLTYLDERGFLHINQTAVSERRIPWARLTCSYQKIIRQENEDSKFTLGPHKIFVQPEILPHEFCVVKCSLFPRSKVIYETGYAQVKDVTQTLANSSQRAWKNCRVNVLIIVLDSMSRLNFIRQLPKTYKFLVESLGSVVMQGLTKVGDNTYPNMLSMLSGLAAKRYLVNKELAPFWGNGSTPRGYFDDLPALWKNFSQNDYVTMFAEDYPKFTAFNYNAHGFKTPPTDYYMRPFWLAMEQIMTHLVSKDKRCFGHLPKHKFLFNYIEQFLYKMLTGKHAFFAFTFLTYLSHDHINSIKIIDDELVIYLENLRAMGIFNNTVTMIMGDHGNRMDPIRNTVIGRVEERMPFLSISIPPQLEHLRNNLQSNAKILTSWHDVYEMLMDLAMNNLNLTSKVIRYGYKGMSLFRPIPNNRTCLQIGIPKEYCICWNEEELHPKDAKTIEKGDILVNHINDIIKSKDKKKVCSLLKLVKVYGAQKLLPPHKVAVPSNLAVLTRVTILQLVEPSNAIIEGTLEQRARLGIQLVGHVSRLNKYGNQSSCVSDPALTLICYCKSRH
ncbi:uncharacterized protein LOC132195978 isoform X2 [Neocloeon triangulifer]|nr:uncharacterized protein LOC132195978 isoform X2 [Neocloeon triangulifer]XP_059474304.1 uncharacterized protein LOC132195978 isoform X2 [Neocloeon triangulifer]